MDRRGSISNVESLENQARKNIVLIGMPGAGKSTIGVVLAKTLGMNFMDTDLVIQELENRLLQDIIDSDGMEAFIEVEDRAIQSVLGENMIIATGGSAVYCEAAMAHLKTLGSIVYLDVSYEEINRRINNITTRGIAIREGATLKDIYEERVILYNRYMDIKIQCDGSTIEEVISNILEVV